MYSVPEIVAEPACLPVNAHAHAAVGATDAHPARQAGRIADRSARSVELELVGALGVAVERRFRRENNGRRGRLANLYRSGRLDRHVEVLGAHRRAAHDVLLRRGRWCARDWRSRRRLRGSRRGLAAGSGFRLGGFWRRLRSGVWLRRDRGGRRGIDRRRARRRVALADAAAASNAGGSGATAEAGSLALDADDFLPQPAKIESARKAPPAALESRITVFVPGAASAGQCPSRSSNIVAEIFAISRV